MSNYSWNHSEQPINNLADAIAGIGKGLHDTADVARAAIDAFVHTAAVGLLHSALPPMVHGQNAVLRAEAWVNAEAATAEIGVELIGARLAKQSLAGAVANKIDDGADRITSRLDYAGGVNSIT